MPVQINELIIKAHVNEPEQSPKTGQPAGALNNEAKEEIIRECIERVLELIHHQKER